MKDLEVRRAVVLVAASRLWSVDFPRRLRQQSAAVAALLPLPSKPLLHWRINALASNLPYLPCFQVMMANVIQRAFDTQPCLSARGELLEGFQAMARRDFIRRFVEKKTVEFYGLFMAEINTVKKLFDAVKRSQPKSPILPRYAGLAKWVRGVF